MIRIRSTAWCRMERASVRLAHRNFSHRYSGLVGDVGNAGGFDCSSTGVVAGESTSPSPITQLVLSTRCSCRTILVTMESYLALTRCTAAFSVAWALPLSGVGGLRVGTVDLTEVRWGAGGLTCVVCAAVSYTHLTLPTKRIV
eukprot:TRINITY_DN7700_c0_g1_i2.p1 TRINITY_DN7700_c0_g1~~TRINITY_DN7700_c0_g1_i2.p1  ORF type:complete len:143 (-),score=5.56 TRINITY_DN7700_c0_g1_i2:143-571(-)